MHCSLRFIVLPQYYFQHSLNNPALRIKKHRSFIEAALMSFGSIISFPKTSYLCRANASHRQTICCTVSVSIPQRLQIGSPSNRPIVNRCPLTGACPV
jgi:hypothetical protein